MEVKLLQILLAMGTLFTCLNAQPVPSSAIELLTAGIAGPRPIRTWTNRAVTGTTPVNANVPDVGECLRQCVNRGSEFCRSVDYTDGQAQGNCQLELYCGNDASVLQPQVGTNHHQFMELCGDSFDLVRWNMLAINGAALPAGVTPFVTTQTSVDACIVECLNQENCQGADYTGSTCRIFVGATNRQRLCLPTTVSATSTAFQYPCLDLTAAMVFSNINEGVYPLLTAAQELTLTVIQQALDYDGCLDACQTEENCGGIRFHSGGLFTTNNLPAGTVRCRHYQTVNPRVIPNILASVCLKLTNPLNSVYTVLKEDCRRLDSGLTGGMVQVQFTSLSECLMECENEPTCVAADWNKLSTTPVNRRCWFLTENNGGCATAFTRPCCDHYLKLPTPCATFDDYTLLDNANLNAGLVVATLGPGSTVMACRDICNSMGQSCQGFDLNELGSCFIYSAGNVCSALRTCNTPGCMHYRKRTFSCMWEFNGFHKAGGIAQSTLPASDMTLPVCLRLCRLDASCQGIDFDETGTTRCWIHRADTICTALLRRNNIMHYRLRQIVCMTTVQNDTLLANATWGNTMQNFHSIGNPLIERNVRSAHACLELCRQRDLVSPGTCSGVDFDKRNGGCYAAARSNACGAGVYDTCCDRLVLPNGCLAAQIPGYGRFTNRHRDRGTMIAGSRTALECAGACNGDPRCAAFDFNPNLRQCWHQTTTQECRNVNIVFNNNCCERYVKSSYTCPTPFVPPNFNGYTLQVFRQVIGALTERQDLNTEELCIQGCNNQGSSCVSVDFNIRSTYCYLHTRLTDPCPENARDNNDVHRYVRTNIPDVC